MPGIESAVCTEMQAPAAAPPTADPPKGFSPLIGIKNIYNLKVRSPFLDTKINLFCGSQWVGFHLPMYTGGHLSSIIYSFKHD